MAKNSYDDLDSFLVDLRSDITDVLQKEISNEMKNIIVEHTRTDVFDEYSPKRYKRRSINGIDDRDSYIANVNGDEITITPYVKFNPGYNTQNSGYKLAELVNDGDGNCDNHYDYPMYEYSRERPYIDNSVREIEDSNRLDKAFENGLRRCGY